MDQQQHASTPKRKLHLEVLRVLAIAMVVYNHSPAYGFLPHEDAAAWAYWGTMLASELCKMAVALFFMISGALLLGRDESLEQLFRKRVLRFLIVIAGYGVLQYGYALYEAGGSMQWSWRLLLQTIYTGWPLNMHTPGYPSAVWFLYAYLGMLLLLPFLRAMVRKLEVQHFLYLFSLQIILVAVLPLAAALIIGSPSSSRCCAYMPFLLAGGIPVYMLLGYFLEHVLPQMPWQRPFRMHLCWLAPLALVCGAVCMELVRRQAGAAVISEHQPGNFLTAFLLLPCSYTYLASMRLCWKWNAAGLAARTACLLGPAVFTVMLTENIFRSQLMPVFERVSANIGSYPASLALVGTTVCCGLMLGCILKRVPILKSYL